MSTKLEFSELGKSFPGVAALAGISFAVKAGEVHALVGENGAGKSTLIKIAAGTQPPSAGEMRLDGKPYRPQNPREALAAGVATIYQERNWLPNRNVMFNLLMGREPRRPGGRLDFNQMRRRSRELLTSLHSESIPLEAPAESLNAGEKQVLEIARALSRESSLLIMDEPTAALARDEREALFAVIGTLKARGLTILYISHRLEEIFRLADRVTVLRDGRHVRTVAISETCPDDLIRDMIGREWAGVFPERNPELGAPLLEVEGLSSRRAFREVSFTLRRGEVLGITGLAGSGKEELGRAIFGAHPVTAGRVRLEGKTVGRSPRAAIRCGLAYLPEDRKTEGLIGALTVGRNISLPVLEQLATWAGRILRHREDDLARTWVDRLAIKTPALSQLAQNLSGGNQQKVVLAKWLASQAKVIVLSHPTQEIDVGVKFELYRLIAELSRAGIGLILISSDLPEVLGLCHTVLCMRDGHLVARLDGQAADSETILRHALGQASSESRPNGH